MAQFTLIFNAMEFTKGADAEIRCKASLDDMLYFFASLVQYFTPLASIKMGLFFPSETVILC